MRRSISQHTLFLFSLSLLVVAGIEGQQLPEESNRLRLAQSLERSGDYEKAARLYEELYSRDPANLVFFDGLHRMYIQLKQYDRAVKLAQRRLERQPGDFNLLGTLGEDYFKAGKETEAYAAWERALVTDQKNQNVYHQISHVLMENRLFAKSVEVLLSGRRVIGNPSLFANDLGFGYTLLGKYGEATKEYLLAMKDNPGMLGFAESRMALYTAKPDGLQAAIGAVQDEVREEKENVNIQRLLAWLYLEGKQFENALSVYLFIDQLTPSSGQELQAFADRAFKEKAYEVSAKAYREVINRYPKSQIMPVAKFGHARVIEELSAGKDTIAFVEKRDVPQSDEQYPANETHPTYGGAIAYYREIAQGYPQSDFAIQSLYRIGLIKFDRFFDIDGALQTLDQIEKQFSPNRVMPIVALKAGEILLAKGEFDKSAERFSRVQRNPLATQDDKDKAMFALAEFDYFQGKFDSASVKLKSLVGNLSANIVNDALLLQQFIKENRAGNELALKEYAQAELLERQRKLSEAVARLEKLLSTFSSAPLIDDALLKIGQLQTKMGEPMRALSIYAKLITEHPESIIRDKAQLSIGEIYHYHLKDNPKAIAAYQELLEKYPNSLFLDEVRKRIRQLRGDSL